MSDFIEVSIGTRKFSIQKKYIVSVAKNSPNGPNNGDGTIISVDADGRYFVNESYEDIKKMLA